jgi:hypothetical protein
MIRRDGRRRFTTELVSWAQCEMGDLVCEHMIYDWASHESRTDGLCNIAKGSLAVC